MPALFDYEIDAMPLIEVMSENDEQNCQKRVITSSAGLQNEN